MVHYLHMHFTCYEFRFCTKSSWAAEEIYIFLKIFNLIQNHFSLCCKKSSHLLSAIAVQFLEMHLGNFVQKVFLLFHLWTFVKTSKFIYEIFVLERGKIAILANSTQLNTLLFYWCFGGVKKINSIFFLTLKTFLFSDVSNLSSDVTWRIRFHWK